MSRPESSAEVPTEAGNLAWDGPILAHRVARKRDLNEGLVDEQPAESTGSSIGRTSRVIAAETQRSGLADDSFVSWSDFFELPLDRRSTCTVFTQGEIDFSQGMEPAVLTDEIEDCFRYFAEGCDRLQGVQAVVDADSAFSGLATAYLTHIRDECPKVSIVTMASLRSSLSPLRGATATRSQVLEMARRRVNCGLAMYNLSALSNIYVPLTMGLEAKAALPYIVLPSTSHCTAVLAAALHTTMAPYRMSAGRVSMSTFCRDLVPFPKLNVLSLEAAIPFDSHVSVLKARQRSSSASTETIVSGLFECAPWMAPLGPFTHGKPVVEALDFFVAERRVLRGTNVLEASWDAGVAGITRNLKETFIVNTSETACVNRQNSFLDQPMTIPARFPVKLFKRPQDRKEVVVCSHLRSFRSQHFKLRQMAEEFVQAGRQLRAASPEALTADELREVQHNLQALVSEYETVQ
eukprot:gb/GEZN01004917.1/.p1 GENE.gb/GEZN01004917.1/~~gb/GEZN01004917.1/.p1  ORF type:complete len:540 (+),score=45.06 gb/GEZN01004917.1/:231-1622(+)